MWLLLAPVLLAQPATTQARQSVEAAATQTRLWIGHPAREERIEAFAPAADIRYRLYETPKPLRMWIAKLDLTAPGVRFAVTEPAEFTGQDARFETRCATTVEFAMQRGVQLAINTSAFGPFRQRMGEPMDVVGLAAVGGSRYSEPDERFGALYIHRDGRVALKGPPLPAGDIWHVIPGFRMLIDDGRIVVRQDVADSKFGGVNPRTAVGVDKDGRTLWIVVVDGRQPGISEGITLVELACLFESLGVWDALNLDGGGSSTLVLENAEGTYDVVNTPVGRGQPNTLRQVANNLGLYLPGMGPKPKDDRPTTLREKLIRLIARRHGGGYCLEAGGVSKDIAYDGDVVLHAAPAGTYCCGATLEAFLDAYCQMRYGCPAAQATGTWFENWPREKFIALQKGWYGTEDAPTNPLIPEEARPTIREKQVYYMLPWTGLAKPVGHYRQFRRGDFVEFWRKNGTGHSVIFWGRDRDEDGRERLWYWSSQKKPRYAYPREPGGQPLKTPGYGINWEYIGDEIDPARIYGVSLVDNPAR
jgi:hypothetical protein